MSLFSPLTLPNGVIILNRIAKAAMEENMADANHAPSAELIRLYRAWGEGGAGLIITGNVMVDARAMTGPAGVVLEDDRHLDRFRAWAAAARIGGGQVWMQINHPGRQMPAGLGQQTLAPSAVPLDLGAQSKMFSVPRAMTEADIADVECRFVNTAELAERAGFTGVEIHAAHGYLLSQFLSPLANRRFDKWGGSLENRARLLLDIVRGIRTAVTPSFTVSVKLNSADFQRGGFSPEDARAVVEKLDTLGVDLVELSGGSYEAPAMMGATRDERTLAREAYFLEFARDIATVATMPLMVTGGMPMSYKLYLEIVSIISEACASTGIIYATNYHGMKPLIDFGNDEQRARLLPRIAEGGLGALGITEPTAGSDATGMKTSFTPDGDEIVIKGSKIFITSGDVADRILLFGKWSGIEDPKKAISVLILEKGAEGFSVIGKERKMGHNGSSTCALSFDNVRVSRANLIGEPGDGLRILLASLNKSRPSIAAHARGIARAAFKDMVNYANDRVQGGRKVLDFQGNQFTLADLACELLMVERWIDYVADLVDGGETDFGMEASVAKLRSTDLAMKMAIECVQFHGGYGYCRDYRAERLMRDAKITQIWEGTNQVHRQLIGRSFIRK